MGLVSGIHMSPWDATLGDPVGEHREHGKGSQQAALGTSVPPLTAGAEGRQLPLRIVC